MISFLPFKEALNAMREATPRIAPVPRPGWASEIEIAEQKFQEVSVQEFIKWHDERLRWARQQNNRPRATEVLGVEKFHSILFDYWDVRKDWKC